MNCPLAKCLSSLVAGAAAWAVVSGPASAAEDGGKPLYEIEAFGMAGYTPDYPGADQNHAHIIAAPWLIYRGDFIRTDERGGVRGVFVDNQRLELDVSVSGSFPASSSNNTARSGMPDLDWLGEVGPRARINLHYWQNYATGSSSRLALELPVRAVFSTDFTNRFDYRGWNSMPAVAYESQGLFGSQAGFKLKGGPMFATQELMDYFYQVKPQYATSGRPAFNASAGYMGSRLDASVSEPLTDRIKLFAHGNLDYLGGSADENSPLLKSKTNLGLQLGASFSFYRSSELAASRN